MSRLLTSEIVYLCLFQEVILRRSKSYFKKLNRLFHGFSPSKDRMLPES